MLQGLCAVSVPPKRHCGHSTVTMLFGFQVQQWEDLQLRLKKEDVAGSEAWLRRNTKPCPKCGCLAFYQFPPRGIPPSVFSGLD